uniref:RanBP2-type domain-containing protein n=1 Tax=Parascaris univalens TaxID=6257 RepID=A0A915C371_PARUN
MSTNAPVENVFGSRAFKPASASGSGSKYVFGFTSSSAGSTSQIIPTDAISAPVSFEPGTSVSANISAEASGLQEAARFDTNHGNLTPGLGLPVSSSTSDVGTASEQAGHAAPQNIEAEHKVKEVQANVAQSTTREGAHLMGASGTMGQGTPTSVFSTLAAPAANKPLAPSAPLFGSLSTSVSTATPQAASAFNFGGTSETQPPTLFGFTTSGAPHATTAPVTSTTTAVLSFSTAAAPSQEDESDSRGTLASNSVEMMSPVEPPSESAAAPLQPFSFAAAANTAQPSGLFNFGTSVTAAPTGTSNTRGLFGGVNTNGALGIAPAAPFQFHPPPAATRAFTTPSVVSSAPSFFNFGGSSTTNGSTEGFSFGSTTTPAFFNFGAQPGPAPSFVFGNNPSSAPPAFMTAPTTNFFASGSSSSTTTTRKMLKARRIRR